MIEPLLSIEDLTELYWKQGLTQKEISNRLNVWTADVSNWMRAYGIPRRTISERHSLKVDFSNNETLSYILGVLLGDGSIFNNKKWHTYQVVMNTTSRTFAESFKTSLEKIGLNPYLWMVKRSEERKEWHPVYRVGASSWRLVNWHLNLTLDDITSLVSESVENTRSFLKGFYESEGCYYKRNRTCSISNSNGNYVKLVSNLLDLLKVHHGVYSYQRNDGRRREFQIQMNQKESEKFLLQIKPCIKGINP